MSAVINRSRQQYKKALIWETGIILTLSFCAFFGGIALASSLLSGLLASFLPHCLFVYWIFFREPAKNASKMSAFYRGEGLKWGATILLIVASFKLLPELHLIAFFVGYFLALCLNIVLPHLTNK